MIIMKDSSKQKSSMKIFQTQNVDNRQRDTSDNINFNTLEQNSLTSRITNLKVINQRLRDKCHDFRLETCS